MHHLVGGDVERRLPRRANRCKSRIRVWNVESDRHAEIGRGVGDLSRRSRRGALTKRLTHQNEQSFLTSGLFEIAGRHAYTDRYQRQFVIFHHRDPHSIGERIEHERRKARTRGRPGSWPRRHRRRLSRQKRREDRTGNQQHANPRHGVTFLVTFVYGSSGLLTRSSFPLGTMLNTDRKSVV